MGDLTPEENWNIDEICERHGLAKQYFKNQLRRMERSYQERMTQLVTHHAPYEEERIALIASLKWEKKTTRPQWFVLWEMLYMLWLWLSANVAVLYLGTALTMLYWTPSIRSITVNETSRSIGRDHYYDMLDHNGFETFSSATYYIMLCEILVCYGLWPIAEAGFKWDSKWLLQAWICNGIALLIEVFMLLRSFRYIPRMCQPDRFREHLFKYFQWYGILAIHRDGRGEEGVHKIHAMQSALACCGIDSYMDYYHIFATPSDPGFNRSWWPKEIPTRRLFEGYDENYYLKNGRDIRQVPPSCCKPIWRHDIYCADNVFFFDENVLKGSGVSLAHERLNQQGCVQAAVEICNQFRILFTWTALGILLVRVVLLALIFIFTQIVYKSVRWKMRWLWTVTEGADGIRYLPAVTSRRDICTSALRQPHDRFDPKLYRWRDTDHINLEVPRQGIPLRTLVKLDDLPSEEEFTKLKLISTSDKPEMTVSQLRESERFQLKQPSVAYRQLREAQRRRGEEARLEALKMEETLANPETRVKELTKFPGRLVEPQFTFYPPQKTVHFKEKKKYNMEVPRLPPPAQTTPADRETRRRQRTVNIDMRFDWEAAIVQANEDESARARQAEKNQKLRAKRHAMEKGVDPTYPWLPAKRELELVYKRMIAADEDDVPPPMWDPRDPDEGKGGFLQPMQEYEIRRKKAIEAGEPPPEPPIFDKRPPMAPISKNPLHDQMTKLVVKTMQGRQWQQIMRKSRAQGTTLSIANLDARASRKSIMNYAHGRKSIEGRKSVMDHAHRRKSEVDHEHGRKSEVDHAHGRKSAMDHEHGRQSEVDHAHGRKSAMDHEHGRKSGVDHAHEHHVHHREESHGPIRDKEISFIKEPPTTKASTTEHINTAETQKGTRLKTGKEGRTKQAGTDLTQSELPEPQGPIKAKVKIRHQREHRISLEPKELRDARVSVKVAFTKEAPDSVKRQPLEEKAVPVKRQPLEEKAVPVKRQPLEEKVVPVKRQPLEEKAVPVKRQPLEEKGLVAPDKSALLPIKVKSQPGKQAPLVIPSQPLAPEGKSILKKKMKEPESDSLFKPQARFDGPSKPEIPRKPAIAKVPHVPPETTFLKPAVDSQGQILPMKLVPREQKSRPGVSPRKSRPLRVESEVGSGRASRSAGGERGGPRKKRSKKRKKKKALKTTVAIRKSVHSIGDFRRLPRKITARMNIHQHSDLSTTTDTEGTSGDRRRRRKSRVKPKIKRMVRRIVHRAPVPISERRAWH